MLFSHQWIGQLTEVRSKICITVDGKDIYVGPLKSVKLENKPLRGLSHGGPVRFLNFYEGGIDFLKQVKYKFSNSNSQCYFFDFGHVIQTLFSQKIAVILNVCPLTSVELGTPPLFQRREQPTFQEV